MRRDRQVGHVSHDDPHRRHKPARHHVMDFERSGLCQTKVARKTRWMMTANSQSPAPGSGRAGRPPWRPPWSPWRRWAPRCPPRDGRDPATAGGGWIRNLKVRTRSSTAAMAAPAVQTAIELTGIFPAPAEAGDPQSQTGHGGQGGGQGAAGSYDHGEYPLDDDDGHRDKGVYRLRYLK